MLEWLVVLLGIPLFYLVTVFVDRLLRPAVAGLWRRLFKDSTLFARHLLPLPIRLLLVAGATRWLLSALPLPLMVRQFGSNAATLLSIAAFVWLVILINRELETNVIQRFPGPAEPRRNRCCASRAGASTCWSSSSECWRRSGISASIRRPRLPGSALAALRWRLRHRRRSRT